MSIRLSIVLVLMIASFAGGYGLAKYPGDLKTAAYNVLHYFSKPKCPVNYICVQAPAPLE